MESVREQVCSKLDFIVEILIGTQTKSQSKRKSQLEKDNKDLSILNKKIANTINRLSDSQQEIKQKIKKLQETKKYYIVFIFFACYCK